MSTSLHKKKIVLHYAPFGNDYIFPKDEFYLGPEYRESDLGYSEGAIRQFRGPRNEHVLEYPDHYKGHRDHTDPHTDPLGHCIRDAPEISLSIVAGGLIALVGGILLFRWKEKKKEESKDDQQAERDLWFYVAITLFIVFFVAILIFFIVKMARESERQTILYS
jgi:hypothetical protein